MIGTRYTIRSGDTLTSIARAHAVPGWQALYFAPDNAAFRRSHPDPDRIFPGGMIVIPKDPSVHKRTLEQRLQRLRSIRAEAQGLFRQQTGELDGALREIQRTSSTVDAAAQVATVFVSLGQLTMRAGSIMKLEGEALKAANRELAKDVLIDRAKNVRDLGATVVSQSKSASTNTVWLVTKSVAQSWCDMTSPSFWANTMVNLYNGRSWSDAVNRRPADVAQEAKTKLMATERAVLKQLDERIQATSRELASVGQRT